MTSNKTHFASVKGIFTHVAHCFNGFRLPVMDYFHRFFYLCLLIALKCSRISCAERCNKRHHAGGHLPDHHGSSRNEYAKMLLDKVSFPNTTLSSSRNNPLFFSQSSSLASCYLFLITGEDKGLHGPLILSHSEGWLQCIVGNRIQLCCRFYVCVCLLVRTFAGMCVCSWLWAVLLCRLLVCVDLFHVILTVTFFFHPAALSYTNSYEYVRFTTKSCK